MARLLSLLSISSLRRRSRAAQLGLILAITLVIASIATPVCWFTMRETPVAQPFVAKSPPGYLFSIYDVEKPLGVAVDPSGQRVVVTETGGQHVTRVYDRDGKELMILVPPGTAPPERAPSYAAIDRLGTVFVSDRARHTIDMYDVNGEYLGKFAPRDNPDISWSPLGLAFDSSDNLYVTDVTDRKHRVMVFDSSGALGLEFGREGAAPGEFAFPNDVAVDNNGQIYVADSNNFRIQVFDSGGRLQAGFTSGGGEAVGFPRGIEIAGDYLYVVDTLGHMVRVYDMGQGAGAVFAFGGLGVGDAQFNFPNGLALDSTGRLYITDRENNRVQVWGF